MSETPTKETLSKVLQFFGDAYVAKDWDKAAALIYATEQGVQVDPDSRIVTEGIAVLKAALVVTDDLGGFLKAGGRIAFVDAEHVDTAIATAEGANMVDP